MEFSCRLQDRDAEAGVCGLEARGVSAEAGVSQAHRLGLRGQVWSDGLPDERLLTQVMPRLSQPWQACGQ